VKSAFFALLIFLPSFVCAAESPGREYSFLSSLIQMMASLFIVVGLILVISYFSRKILKNKITGGFGSKYIRVVETRPIAPRKSLILIEVGGEYLLLSCADNQLTLIKQVEIYEEIEIIDEPEDNRRKFLGLFDRNKQ